MFGHEYKNTAIFVEQAVAPVFQNTDLVIIFFIDDSRHV